MLCESSPLCYPYVIYIVRCAGTRAYILARVTLPLPYRSDLKDTRRPHPEDRPFGSPSTYVAFVVCICYLARSVA
jgi:hypothetical protein